jgi:DNA-binding CsgD family transcriptional regulator
MTPGVVWSYAEHLPAREGHGLLDTSLRTIFDDLSEGVLVVDTAGQRVYSNPALNEMVGANACLPAGSPEPPPYVPVDQRQRYILALKGSSSLLTLDGSGTTSTWLELDAPGVGRVRTRVTISAFTGARGWRFAVWLLNTGHGHHGAPARVPMANGGTDGQSEPADGLPAWGALSAVGSLTRRERDVLQLLLDGRRVSSIARSLYLSPQTVRNHLKAIFRKLGAHSQAELLDSLRPTANERPNAPEPRSRAGATAHSLEG